MHRMTAIFSGVIWAGVAGIVIFFIFRIAMMYVGLLNDAVKQAL
jgi:tetrahydromethanopterin S-methyltransferase subunit F